MWERRRALDGASRAKGPDGYCYTTDLWTMR